MHCAGFRKTEIHDQRDDHDRRSEDGEKDDEDDGDGNPRHIVVGIVMVAIDREVEVFLDLFFDRAVDILVGI